MMRKLLFYTMILMASGSAVSAQEYETDTVSRTALEKLSFMTGNWEGEGWMMGRDGQKNEFTQTEKIRFKLDGTVLLIEGQGTAGGIVIHDAMAIVSYDKEENNYTFQSYLKTGRKGEFDGELIDGKFYWYPNPQMRYIIGINEQGQWYETGEFARGEGWFQFFEMTLDRVSSATD